MLLIGAGTMGERAAKQLVRHGLRELLVAGRDAEPAGRFVQRHSGRVVTSDRLGEASAQSEVVISRPAPQVLIVRRHQFEHAVAGSARADVPPLLLIDVPFRRGVHPAGWRLAGVDVRAVDDLRLVVERALMLRRARLPAAHAIVAAEVAPLHALAEPLPGAGSRHGEARAGNPPMTPMCR